MTVKMFCDGPECEAVVDVTTKGWLTVQRRDENNTPDPVLNFCSWLCLFERARESVTTERLTTAG